MGTSGYEAENRGCPSRESDPDPCRVVRIQGGTNHHDAFASPGGWLAALRSRNGTIECSLLRGRPFGGWGGRGRRLGVWGFTGGLARPDIGLVGNPRLLTAGAAADEKR